jgi:hypothetical protein
MVEQWQVFVLSTTGETAQGFEAVPQGANNCLFKVNCKNGIQFALKYYPGSEEDTRNRLMTEFTSLQFLAPRCNGVVPEALGYDEVSQIALYQWIEGEAIKSPSSSDIQAALAFIGRLKELGSEKAAKKFAEASEACLTFTELTQQIENRYEKLLAVSDQDPDLTVFLEDSFQPRFQSLSRKLPISDVAHSDMCLSPSDFGFHNALRCRDDHLVFVDFEYFGWDDPVKLVCDFLLHPAMDLSTTEKAQFWVGAKELFAGDPAFEERFYLLYPYYALRWCMILLNEFLPERWQRRQAAGAVDNINDKKCDQLLKSQAWYIKSEGFQEWTPDQ